MNAKQYLKVVLGMFLFLSAIVITTNFAVDPYLMTNFDRVDHFNRYKADINNHVRTTKAYHSEFRNYDTLIIGNSRVEMGISPNHSCFMNGSNNVYNLGLPGASVRAQVMYALNIIYQQPIKKVFMSVDFTDFIISDLDYSSAPSRLQDTVINRLRYQADGTKNPDFNWTRFWDYYRALYSLDAFISSLKTILFQSTFSADRDENGFNPANDFYKAAKVEGAQALFKQKMHMMEKKYTGIFDIYYDNGEPSSTFQVLKDFLSIAKAQGVEVVLFTNPFHKQFWLMLERHELITLYDRWLNELMVLITEMKDQKLALWDFSMESEYINEPVLSLRVEAEPLKWFWEPAHYRKELGDLMLNSMLSDVCGSPTVFGKRIGISP